MKFLQRICAVMLLVATGYMAQAQYCGNSGPTICTALHTLTAPGFSPPSDSVPCAIQGVAYNQTVQVKMPNTVTQGTSTYKLKSIKIDSVLNLPCGLCWSTNRANNTFDSSEQFCLRVTGTTYDNPGQFKLRIIVDATVYVLGPITTVQTADASAAGLKFWLRVQTPTGTCIPIDTLATGNTAIAVGATPSNAVTAGGPLSFCTGGSVVFTATEAGASYQWYKGGVAITSATSRTYTATTAGAYTVNVIKNCHGVTSTAQTVVVNSPPTASVTPAGPVILCGGSTQVLTAAVSTGSTIQWYNAAGAISGQTSTTYTATASGTYYAIATLNGCTGTSNSVSVQISGTAPTPTITATTLSICAGASDTLDAGVGYNSYAWSGGGTTHTKIVTAAGTYTVTVTNGVCSGTGSISIAQGLSVATPTITPGGSVTICQGSGLTLTSSSASSYTWTGGAHTQSITVTSAGSYSVTVTQNGQCGTASAAPTTVAVTPRPTAAVTPAGPVIICGSGSAVLTATGGGTYQWLKNGAPIVAATNNTYTATTAGNYSVIVTANSCFDTSNIVSVQIGSSLTPTITATHPYICTGSTDTLDAGAGYTSYSWSGGGTGRTKIITASGSYSVTVSNGACSGTATINITPQGPTATPTITPSGPTTFCTGGSVVLTSSSLTGNVWSTTATTPSITVTTGGSYTVTNDNGCGAATSTATVVTVNPIPVAHITPAGSTLICGGSSQTLTATPAGASYVWLDSSSVISGQTGSTYSATTSGAYRVLVTQNGCSDTSNTATITVSGTPPTPVITATATTLCPGAIDTLDVGAGYTSYAWSGSLGTSSNATVTSGGTYTVTVYNGVCQGTATITINQGVAVTTPVITSSTGSLNICGSDSIVLTSSAATGNAWNNSATTQSVTVYNAGIFFVTVSSSCGTATSASDTVTKFNFPAVSLGNDTGTCAGDSLTLDAGANGSSYRWSTNDSTPRAIVMSTSMYYVSVTRDGCTAVDSVQVTFDSAPAASFTTASGVLTASAGTGYRYQWKKNGADIAGATSQTLDANPSGTANYSVVVANGFCSATSVSQLITITGISELSQSLSLDIYPNPTNKEVTVSYVLSRSEALEVYMTDMTGRTVRSLYTGNQADGEYKIVTDLTSLTGGVYFVNFRTQEGIVVRKIVKE